MFSISHCLESWDHKVCISQIQRVDDANHRINGDPVDKC